MSEALALTKEALVEHPTSLLVIDQAVGVFDHLGYDEEAYEQMHRGRAERLRRLGGVVDLDSPPPRLGREQRIMISGFFYSGSGCALDYLKAFPGTYKWAPSGEVRLLKAPGGLADLAKRHREQEQLTTADVVDFYLHIVGRKVIETRKGAYSHRRKVNRNSRRLVKRKVARSYVAACLQLVQQIDEFRVRGKRSQDQLEELLTTGFSDAIDAAAWGAGAQTLLLDQTINAWRMPIAHLAPPSTFVVVHRDPRDHFAEARVAQHRTGRKVASVEDFVKQYRERHDAFDEQARAAADQAGHEFIRLRFEDFVLDHDAQSKLLCDRLGLDPADFDPAAFDIAASRPNVGKHHYLLSDKERARISKALPEYLHPGADDPPPVTPHDVVAVSQRFGRLKALAASVRRHL